MNLNNIFISQNEIKGNDIAGKVTYTTIIQSIPENRSETQIDGWKNKYKTEWRWRFLKIKERYVVEISYITHSDKRMYFNRYGEWVERYIDPIFNQFVEKQYYVYTNE